MPYISSWERFAKEEGRQEGLQEGQKSMQTLALTLLEQRFGKVTPELGQQLEGLTIAQLQELGKQLLSFNNYGDLTNWLQQR